MTITEYNKCVDEHSNGVYRFILKNLRDDDAAKDIVQDAFEKMWLKVNDVEASKAKSYLFTTAYHNMIDVIRRNKFSTIVEEHHFNINTSSNSYSDLKEILDEALAKLPEVQKSVVLLRDYEGYTYEEIGQITGLSEAQVKVYIYRARVFLKNYIGSLETVI